MKSLSFRSYLIIILISCLNLNLNAENISLKSELNTENLDFEVCTENVPQSTERKVFIKGDSYIKAPVEGKKHAYTFTGISDSEDQFDTFASFGDFSQNIFPSENFLLPRMTGLSTAGDPEGNVIFDLMCGNPIDNSEKNKSFYLNSAVNKAVLLLTQITNLDEDGMPIFDQLFTTANLSEEVSQANRCFTCVKPAEIPKEGYCFYEARNSVLGDLEENYDFNLYDAFHEDESKGTGLFHMTSTYIEFKKINQKDDKTDEIKLFSETYMVAFEEVVNGKLTTTSTHLKEVTYKFEDGYVSCIETK